MKKILGIISVAVLFMATLSSCDGNNPTDPSDEPIILTQTIKTDKKITLFVDSTYQIKVTVTPEDANEPLVWSSDNSNVATVDQQGIVTAISDGECNVSVQAGSLTAATKVTVINNPVTLELELYSVEQKKCTVTVTPSNENGYYYCGYAPADEVSGMSDEAIIDALFKNVLQIAEQYAAYGAKLTDFLQSGTKNLIASGLTANTTYEMFAFGIDTEYNVASPKLARMSFKTAEVEMSDMTIEIKYDSTSVTTSGTTTETKLWFSATPSNDDPYIFNGAIDLEEEFGTAQEFLDYLEYYYDTQYASYGGVEALIKTGASTMTAKNPEDGAVYTLVAAGYKGGWTTEPFTFKYEYKAATESMPARLVPYVEKLDNCVELKKFERRPFIRTACY